MILCLRLYRANFAKKWSGIAFVNRHGYKRTSSIFESLYISNAHFFSTIFKLKRESEFKAKHPIDASIEPYQSYGRLRPVRLILTDDKPINRNCAFNKAEFLAEIKSNVVSCSTDINDRILALKSDSLVNIADDIDLSYSNQFDFDFEKFDVKEESIDSCSGSAVEAESDEVNELNQSPKWTKTNFVIADKKKSLLEWEECFADLSMLLSGYTRSTIFKSLMDFFNNIAVLKYEADVTRQWHTSPLVKSYLIYLIKDQSNLTLAQPTMTTYLKYCNHVKDYDAVVYVYNMLQSKITVYSYGLLLELITGLSLGGRLQDAAELLKIYGLYKKNNLTKSNTVLVVYGHGCFLNKKPETGIEIMKQQMMANLRTTPLLQPFLEHFRFVDDREKWKENFEVVMSFFNWIFVNNIFISKNEAKSIADWFTSIKNERWKCFTYENRHLQRGRCPVTNHPMNLCKLNPEEYMCLKNSISEFLLDSSVDDVSLKYIKDIPKSASSQLFHHSSLKDLKKYLEYLHENGPFDLIIDGMNFAHLLLSRKKSFFGKHKHKTSLKELGNVLYNYRKKPINANKKICLIIRKHMYDHVRVDGQFFYDLCDIYFAPNNLSDDVLLIYGAISSGPQCFFASHDLFRDYRAKIAQQCDLRLVRLFDRYQRSRQLFYQRINNTQHLPHTPAFEAEIQKTEDSWYFPYFPEPALGNTPTAWLCATKKTDVTNFKSSPI